MSGRVASDVAGLCVGCDRRQRVTCTCSGVPSTGSSVLVVGRMCECGILALRLLALSGLEFDHTRELWLNCPSMHQLGLNHLQAMHTSIPVCSSFRQQSAAVTTRR